MKNEIMVVGGVHDIATGIVTLLDMKTKIDEITFDGLGETEESYVERMSATHNMLWRQGGLRMLCDTGEKWQVSYCWQEKPQRWPVAYHTVDIAMIKNLGQPDKPLYCVLMIQKKSEVGSGLWRFPGGFIDPGETAEAAAARELMEETRVILDAESMEYVGSFVIDDPRYKATPDGITTSMFAVSGELVSMYGPGDDAAEVAMVPVFPAIDVVDGATDMSLLSVINPIHRELAKSLVKKWGTLINQINLK